MASWRKLNGWQLLGADLPDIMAVWPPAPAQPLRDNAKLQAFVWQHQDQAWFVKCFRYQGLRRWAARLGRERGLAGFEAAVALRAAGINTPAAPLLVRQSNCARSWLLTELLNAAQNCHQLSEQPLSAEFKQQLFEAGLALLLQLHHAGFAHGDFKWANLMWQQDKQRLWLIDLDGVVTSGAGSRAQLRDLARFLLNAEEVGIELARLQQAFADYCISMKLDTQKARPRYMKIYARLARRHGREVLTI